MIRPEWLRKLISVALCGLSIGMLLVGFLLIGSVYVNPIFGVVLCIYGFIILILTMIELTS